MSAILLISICEHSHLTETEIRGAEIDDQDNLVGGGVSSDADFCAVCESGQMTPLGWRVQGGFEGVDRTPS